MIRTWCAAGAAALALGAASSQAGVMVYEVMLEGTQESPPVATSGFGSATVTLNTVTGDVEVTGVYADMLGEVTASHIHGPAAPGVNADVIFGLMVTGGMSGSISGMGTLSMADVDNMLNGLTYINVHSTFAPGGEIRGQIVPAPAGAATLAAIAGVCAVRRRR